ncbi:unnamed protein product [Zymoseptoria tritici ST99CH_3D7]|uniref:PhoD-like phosphatase domain-containing protein n=1 Tax=Zymoseptoria tritici (strain ST99CH_3D7) TaxID=1276538 RepID=A0A1X7RUZ6_ZYMT9|nr:unnamed protein product [Zymoseptoria tritici ST99CH_3D7]
MATHNRRQSGLWAQNNDGFFSQLSGPSALLSSNSASVPEGPYQYYQSPQPRSQDQAQDGRRTFSDRSGNEPPMASPTSQSRSSQAPHQPALTVDPNFVPPNMRSKPWFEEAMTPRTAPEFPLAIPLAMQPQIKPQRQGSSASETKRRGSVPDKSPLQNLEVWSKDEKRARVERAEGRVAREKSGNGYRAASDSAAMAQRSRQSSGGPMSPTYMASPTNAGAERIPPSSRKENLAQHVFPNQAKAIDRGQTRARVSTDGDIATRTRIKEGGWAGLNNGAAYDHVAAERGRLAYERRKNQMQAQAIMSGESPISPVSREGQSGSLRVQKREDDGYKAEKKKKDEHNHIKSDRMASVKQERQAAEKYDDPDPIPPEQVRTEGDGVPYSIPPQTAAGQQAREQVGFGNGDVQKDHHRFGGMFHRDHRQHRSYTPEPFLDEWRQAKVAKLTVEDLDLDAAVKASQKEGGDAAWWEKGRRVSSSGSASRGAPPNMAQYDGPYEEQANGFKPRLYLKCGPLLRYTGMRKETSQSRSGRAVEKEVWRGSVMILTEDDQSDVSTAPVLRMFAQQMDLMPPPPAHLDSHELPPEFEDPVAGQVKLSRTGRALYVRPVHDIDPSVDLSREENNEGLYAATRTSVLGPQTSGPDGRQSQHITFQDKSRIKRQDGEKAGRFREVKAVKLHSERGHTFWRFSIEVELASKQTRVAYRINNGPAVAFWVPGKGDTMNIMFHSCNGFSMSVDSDTFSGPDPLWRDVLNRHQSKPFHVMLGGGDQVYNDAVMRDTELFKEWLQMKNPEHKHHADFTPAMQNELEEFYLNRYAMWFSQGLFGMANSQIPMVNIWDDHDIIDGFGSYPHHFMATRVFTGLGAIAHKYYMLFQHQSLVAETEKDEPSWLLGRSPGPYINQLSRSVFLHLGRKIAFLGLDCRTERMRDEILSQETYDVVFDRLRAELHKDETKHLIVLLGVPIAYPRLNFLENILTSRVMDPIKALGRKGMLGGFVNKFDGGVEILDDLDDHWTAKHHKAERNWLIQELQDLAREKSIRITILGGDVHLAAIGQFYSAKDLAIPKDKDWRYMPNVISSAIVNTPPPNMMADVLNKRNKVHKLDRDTEEVMIPMFSHDVDSSRRNNQALMPRRNFCVISEYVPGNTPPGSPKLEAADGQGGEDGAFGPNGGGNKDRRFPPGSMKRAMSQGPMSIVRRLSGSSKKRPSFDMAQPLSRDGSIQRANSLQQQSTNGDKGYFPSKPTAQRPSLDASATQRRPSFHRAPTDLSKKASRAAAARIGTDGNADGRAPGHIDLEDGLDVSLCVEIDQHDPIGRTIPYRLLVPALWCDGPNRLAGMAGGGVPAGVNEGQNAGFTGGMVQDEHEEGGRGLDRKKRLSLLERLKSMRRREQKSDEREEEWSQSDSEEEIQLRHHDERQQQQHEPRRDQLDGDDGYRPPPPAKAASTNPADALGLSTTGRGAVQHQRSDPQEPVLSTAGRQSMDGATRNFHQAQSVGYNQRAQRGQQTQSQTQSQSQSQSQSTQANSMPRQVLTKPPPVQQPHVQHHLFHHQTQHAEAYKQGLSLAGPPIGAHQRQQQTQRQTSASSTNGAFIPTNGRPGGLSNNPYPSVGLKNGAGPYRHSSAPVGGPLYQQQGQARGGAKRYDEYDDEGYSHEDEYDDDDEAGYGQGRGKERRGSKAERFFGLVGGSEGKEGRTGSLKGRGWKVWK